MKLDKNTIRDTEAPHPQVRGRRRNGRIVVSNIRFPDKLYHEIVAEAKKREWSFSHMVRHLCEASIEGIE